jgi:hypothetical protein
MPFETNPHPVQDPWAAQIRFRIASDDTNFFSPTLNLIGMPSVGMPFAISDSCTRFVMELFQEGDESCIK